MPLNENEERVLREIEQRFYASDRESAERLAKTTLPRYLARNCKWATLSFLVGLAILVLSFATNWVVAIIGFVVMLASAISLTRNLRRMGRHGVEQVRETMRSRNFSEALDEYTQRMRRRFGRDED